MTLGERIKSAFRAAWAFIDNHGTKVLGFVGGSIAAVAGTGIIPEVHMKYYMALVALATFWRGFINSNRQEATPK